MFDLWVDNDDRGKGVRENYNLLLQSIQIKNEGSNTTTSKLRWQAFDHAFTFGGIGRLRMFNETMMPTTAYKLIESQYYNAFKNYFIRANYEPVIENFLTLQRNELEDIIQSVFSQIPEDWQTPGSLAERIILFLSNNNRISSVNQLTINSFNK
jgi:hypothetical protein